MRYGCNRYIISVLSFYFLLGNETQQTQTDWKLVNRILSLLIKSKILSLKYYFNCTIIPLKIMLIYILYCLFCAFYFSSQSHFYNNGELQNIKNLSLSCRMEHKIGVPMLSRSKCQYISVSIWNLKCSKV